MTPKISRSSSLEPVTVVWCSKGILQMWSHLESWDDEMNLGYLEGHKVITGVLIKGRPLRVDYKGDGDGRMKAEIGVMWLQTKECQRLSARKALWTNFSLTALKRNQTCWHLNFGILAS